MTLQEFYQKTGADYDGVIRRLVNEKMALKYVKKFPNDCHFELLQQSIQEQDYETAYRAVHTLKGLYLSLGFDALSKPVIALTEELRAGITENAQLHFSAIAHDYETITGWISELTD